MQRFNIKHSYHVDNHATTQRQGCRAPVFAALAVLGLSLLVFHWPLNVMDCASASNTLSVPVYAVGQVVEEPVTYGATGCGAWFVVHVTVDGSDHWGGWFAHPPALPAQYVGAGLQVGCTFFSVTYLTKPDDQAPADFAGASRMWTTQAC